MQPELNDLLYRKQNLHADDPLHAVYWHRILDLLRDDEKETIRFIAEVEDEQVLFTIAGFFGPLAGYFQSREFIAAAEAFYQKFKTTKYAAHIRVNLEEAKEALD